MARGLFPMIATAGFVLAVPILLFTTNIRFLASDTGYIEGGIRRHDAAENTGITQFELDYAVGEIVRYFEDDAETLRLRVWMNGRETALFSAEETTHMEDVKGLMRAIFRANEVSLGFVLAYVAATLLWSGERSGRDLARETLAALGVGSVVGAAVGITALIGFESAWERLHEVIFTNDFWRLDPDEDRLIQMFPESFWAEATFIVVGLALAEAVALVGVAGGYLWFTRPPRTERAEPVEAEVMRAGDVDEREAPPGETAPEADAVEPETDAGESAAPGSAISGGGAGAEVQEEQPQPPPPQAQPPAPPNSPDSI